MEETDGNNDEDWQTVCTQKQKRAPRLKEQFPEWFQTLEAPSETEFEPYVLMLMGIPGSGKSTIAEKLCELEPWKYVRVNQDTLGDRKKCLKLAKQALNQRKCPIIDRCHASFMNREPFHELAKSFNVSVDILIIDAPHNICLERCRRRRIIPRCLRAMPVGYWAAFAKTGAYREKMKIQGRSGPYLVLTTSVRRALSAFALG